MIKKNIALLGLEQAKKEYVQAVQKRKKLEQEKTDLRYKLKNEGLNNIQVNKQISPIKQKLDKAMMEQMEAEDNIKKAEIKATPYIKSTNQRLKEIQKGLRDNDFGSSIIANQLGYYGNLDGLEKLALKNLFKAIPEENLTKAIERGFSKEDIKGLVNLDNEVKQILIDKYSDDGTLQGIPPEKREQANKEYSEIYPETIKQKLNDKFPELFTVSEDDKKRFDNSKQPNGLLKQDEDNIKNGAKLFPFDFNGYVLFNDSNVYLYDNIFGTVKFKAIGTYENGLYDYASFKNVLRDKKTLQDIANNMTDYSRKIAIIEDDFNQNFKSLPRSLNSSIKQISKSADTYNPKYELNGVYLDSETPTEGVNIVATDTRVMSLENEPFDGKTTSLIPTTIAKKIDKVNLSYSSEYTLTKIDIYEFVCGAIHNGKYPLYMRVFPIKEEASWILTLQGAMPSSYELSMSRSKNLSETERISPKNIKMRKTTYYDVVMYVSNLETENEIQLERDIEDTEQYIINQIENGFKTGTSPYKKEDYPKAIRDYVSRAKYGAVKVGSIKILDRQKQGYQAIEFMRLKTRSHHLNDALSSKKAPYEMIFNDNNLPYTIEQNNTQKVIMPQLR